MSDIFGDLVYASHVVFIVVSARKAQKRKRYYDEYQSVKADGIEKLAVLFYIAYHSVSYLQNAYFPVYLLYYYRRNKSIKKSAIYYVFFGMVLIRF